jgi:DNA-binding NtrC family response regulator
MAWSKTWTVTKMAKPMDKRTILIVEDEPPLLGLLKQILEEAGYRVFTAKDGLEARDVYRREQDAIDLVLSDMALPKFGGWTVYLMLKEINPRVKMILTSGYLDPQVKRDMVRGGAKDFIPKPYVAETVLKSVEAALGG